MAVAHVNQYNGGNYGFTGTNGGTITCSPASTSILFAQFGVYSVISANISALTQTHVTWTAVPSAKSSYSTQNYCQLWMGIPSGGTPGASITVTFSAADSGARTSWTAVVDEYSGITNTTVENIYTANDSSSLTVTPQVTGVVLANAGDMEICFCVCAATTAPSAYPSWEMITGFEYNGSSGSATASAVQFNVGPQSSHTSSFTIGPKSSWACISVIIEASPVVVFPESYSETISVSDTLQFALARTLATETGIQSVIADTLVRHHLPGGPRTFTETIITMVDLGIVKDPGKLPKETITITDTFSKVHMPGGPQTFTEALLSISDTFSWHGSFHPTFSEVFTLLEPVFGTVQGHFANLTDTFTLSDLFNSVHAQFMALADAIALVDVTSLTHDQQLAFAEPFPLSDSISETHTQLLAAAEAFTVSDVFSAVHTDRLTLTDVIALVESLVKVYTPGGGGGPIPVPATGALTGASSAAAVVAALIFATALGSGRIAGLAAVAYQVSALLRGLCILNGLAGSAIVESGAATGGSAASGIEGAQLVVVGGSTEGDSDAEAASGVWTASIGEADGVSPEMDCDTQCIFMAEGNTMPDTPGSAVAVATYALLHLIAMLTGASLAVGQVHSPVVASGGCEGDSSAQYVSIALYDAEAVGGESEAVGVAGGLFHVSGQCEPIMASNASGTANYGPGEIAGQVAGRGVVAGVPTVLAA
jgi:hypothetical protein